MSNFEFNKLFAAVLCALLVIWVGGFAIEKLVHPKALEKDAVTIEGASDEHGGAAVDAGPQGPEPILALIAAADVEKGAKISKACAACHAFEKGGANKQGPGLWGIVGNAKASHEGFEYSAGLKAKGGNWDYDSLNHFLWKPKKYVADTKMNFIGLKKPEERAALIAWLRNQADSAAALPTDAEIAAEAAVTAATALSVPAATVEGAASATDAVVAEPPKDDAAGAPAAEEKKAEEPKH
jgi:cytochrome c